VAILVPLIFGKNDKVGKKKAPQIGKNDKNDKNCQNCRVWSQKNFLSTGNQNSESTDRSDVVQLGD